MIRRSLLAAVFATALIAVPAASAATQVTIQGTSDVTGSGLIQNVVQPGFQAAYPQYTLNYVGVGTGQAIANAKLGLGAGLVTHAAAQEAAFVAGGYSVEPYGRAVFYGDYVILGPKGSDPAGVLAGAPHDAAAAFAKIAAAGTANNAKFISRADDSGTNTEEHAIWALTNSGIPLCTYTGPGGGKEPSSTSGTCPQSLNPPQAATPPPWYIRTGLTSQAGNVQATDACAATGSDPSTDDCYTITDRGTFNKLVQTGAITKLQVVGDKNASSAPGGPNLLVNSFHAYAVNPAKVPANSISADQAKGALAFLDYLTAPSTQAKIDAYTTAALLGDAVPGSTASGLPGTVTAGTPFTVSGTISNKVPGTPPLNNVVLGLQRSGVAVARATTSATGAYRFTYTPNRSGAYSLAIPPITKLEIPTSSPPFGDLLTAGTRSLGTVAVKAKIGISKVTTAYRQAVVSGTAAPSSGRSAAKITILGHKGKGATKTLKRASLPATGSGFAIPVNLSPGSWTLSARYDDPGAVLSATSGTKTAKVPGTSGVRFTKLVGGHKVLRLRGLVKPKPTTRGALLGIYVRRGPTRKFHRVKLIKLARGHAHFKAVIKLRSHRYGVRVHYVHTGAVDSSFSRVRSVKVLKAKPKHTKHKK